MLNLLPYAIPFLLGAVAGWVGHMKLGAQAQSVVDKVKSL